MSEFTEAIALANKVLNDPSEDPDSELAMLSRQFLRRNEAVDLADREKVAAFRLISRLWKLLTLRTLQYRGRCQGTVRDTKLEGEIVAALNGVDEAETAMKEFGYTGPDWQGGEPAASASASRCGPGRAGGRPGEG
jgi:hypothetical protein